MENYNVFLNVVTIIFGFLFVVSVGACLIFQHKLLKYLREKHYEKWKYLTTLLGLGPGNVNGIRGIVFIFNNEDLSDAEVMRLKRIVRNFVIMAIISVIGATITAFMMTMFVRKY